MNEAAAIAVRQTEGKYVRPILKDRLVELLQILATDCAASSDPLHYRIQIFTTLQQRMGLSSEEKQTAKKKAVQFLVDHLRSVPNPPIHVQTDADVAKQRGKLDELIETAYNLRPRPHTDMLTSFAMFCHGIPGGAVIPGGTDVARGGTPHQHLPLYNSRRTSVNYPPDHFL